MAKYSDRELRDRGRQDVEGVAGASRTPAGRRDAEHYPLAARAPMQGRCCDGGLTFQPWSHSVFGADLDSVIEPNLCSEIGQRPRP